MGENYRSKGKLALGIHIKNNSDINLIENEIFNHAVTTDEYKLIIQEAIGLFKQNNDIQKLHTDIKENKYLYGHSRFDKIRKRIQEYNNFIIKPFEVDEGVLTCNKCNSNKTYSYTKQTRSGDESTTVFAICSNCNARWTIN